MAMKVRASRDRARDFSLVPEHLLRSVAWTSLCAGISVAVAPVDGRFFAGCFGAAWTCTSWNSVSSPVSLVPEQILCVRGVFV